MHQSKLFYLKKFQFTKIITISIAAFYQSGPGGKVVLITITMRACAGDGRLFSEAITISHQCYEET